MEHILSGLNEQQRIAVESFGTPLMVLAGAGSGKTRVITTKFAYIVKKYQIPANNILAITFTKKAAEEMKGRVEEMLGIRPRYISTFHAFCVQILRQDIEYLDRNWTNKFIIYDEDDSKKILKEALRRCNMKPSDLDAAKNVLSNAKQEYRNDIIDYIRSLPMPRSSFAEVAKIYQEELEASNALDYDDIIYQTTELLGLKATVRDKWSSKFSYIMVDEYQDTNKIQYNLIGLILANGTHITVVGDSQQSIYGWRGANPENLLKFSTRFSATEIKLERNYRSTENILDIANRIISKSNQKWEGKILKLWTNTPNSGEVLHLEVDDNRAESTFIVDKINELTKKKGYKYSDIAILMRMQFLSRGMENALMHNGIPYQLIGQTSFFDRQEVKDLLAYLRIIYNRQDRAAFERIINTPARGLGDKAIGKVKLNYQRDWIQALSDTTFTGRQAIGVNNFISIIDKYTDTVDTNPYTTVMGLIEDLNFETHLKEHFKDDYYDRIGNISELANALKVIETEEKTFAQFMEDSLLSAAQDEIKNINSVTMMTIHAAKGLEFPVVFIIANEEGIFPAAKSLEDAGSSEEERRLFYVASTRAKQCLYMTTAQCRMKFGEMVWLEKSRYISDIEDLVTKKIA